MSVLKVHPAARLAGWGLALLLALGWATPAPAADLKLEVKLVWGTHEEKSPNPKHKPVDGELAAKLRKVFKWKNYYEVNRLTGTVPSRGSKKFRVSEKCEIEVTEMEGPRVEVKLYGEGKLINKTVKSLSKGEYFTLAGDDKNETAWFVIVTLLEEIRGDDKK